MKLGVEVFLERHTHLVKGRRVGLITNPTGVDANLVSIVERLRAHPDIRLAALYGPEHGLRGDAQAGEVVGFHEDKHLHLPVYSLYGQSRAPAPTGLADIDAMMREYDTQHSGKTVAPEMLQAVDVLLFDLQDVGTRVYTYVATMAYAMQAAAEAGIPFVVLDRPNPINGVAMEGPILEFPALSSFIGLYAVPLRHAMTTGELARLFNDRFLTRRAELTVIPLEGWRRHDWYDTTRLPWVIPSPNLPTLEAATVYPGQVMLEGTNLSEGRGTTKPFEFFGAPWIDGYVLARELNALQLAGAVFREVWFTPTFSKFSGERCGGCQLHVTERDAFAPVAVTLAIIETVRRLYGQNLQFHAAYYDHVLGTATVRRALEAGIPVREITVGFEAGLSQFARTREPYLLYS